MVRRPGFNGRRPVPPGAGGPLPHEIRPTCCLDRPEDHFLGFVGNHQIGLIPIACGNRCGQDRRIRAAGHCGNHLRMIDKLHKKERACKPKQTRSISGFKNGGRYRIRTSGLLLVRQALYTS